MTENQTVEIFHSNHIGDYKITIYHPNEVAPAGGWPIVYLLDGDEFFDQTVDIIKNKSLQAVIVAVGYPDKTRRSLDYLPKPPELKLEILSNGKINVPEAYGGADNFLAFLETELKPNIEKRFSINKAQQIIFGHSLGGLFALHTLFTNPNAFSHYLVSSPSIWFSDRYILQESAQFIEQTDVMSLTQTIDVQISVGEFEQSLTGKETFSTELEKQLRLKHLQNRRMVDNTKELAEQLNKANIESLTVNYQVYQNQTHQQVPYVVLKERLPILLKQ